MKSGFRKYQQRAEPEENFRPTQTDYFKRKCTRLLRALIEQIDPVLLQNMESRARCGVVMHTLSCAPYVSWAIFRA